MKDWKKRLYDGYVSTKQAPNEIGPGGRLSLKDNQYFVNMINKHLPSDTNIKIADLACGHGSLIFCLKEKGYNNVEGVDISAEQVDLAHSIGIPEVKLIDINEFLNKNSNEFNVVFMIDILEHLTKQELFGTLDNAYNSLKGTGKVIIHTPNAGGIFGVRRFHDDLTHQICFTSQSIKQVLYATGFKEINIFEDKPLVYGLRSFIASTLWNLLNLYPRLLLITESGWNNIMTQSMLVVAEK